MQYPIVYKLLTTSTVDKDLRLDKHETLCCPYTLLTQLSLVQSSLVGAMGHVFHRGWNKGHRFYNA